MNKHTKTNLVLFFGIIFIASLSADPLLHDHIDEHESESVVECQLCENKTFDLKNSDSEISELIKKRIEGLDTKTIYLELHQKNKFFRF